MSPLLNSPLRRGELTSDFVLHRGNSLKFIPFISSNSRYLGFETGNKFSTISLEEARIIRRLFTDLDTTSDLQKPDKILLDNTNLLHTLSQRIPETGTVREICTDHIAVPHSSNTYRHANLPDNKNSRTEIRL